MKPREIKVNVLSVASIDRAIRETEKYKRWLDTRTKQFLKRLQEAGIEAALKGYQEIEYAGQPDVLVDPPGTVSGGNGKYTARVRATGDTVLFIEFGTGIYNENAHQLAYGYAAGSYGDKALQPWGWFYTGSPGPHDPPSTEPANKHKHSMHTYGNRENKVIYDARKDVREKVASIAEEVFGR